MESSSTLVRVTTVTRHSNKKSESEGGVDTDDRFQLCYTQLHFTALPLLQLEQQNLWIWTWSMGCGRNDSIESIVYKHYDCYLDKCKTVFQVQRLCIWELINHDGQLSKLVYKIQYSEGLLWNWSAIILVYCKYHFQASTDLDNEMTICERISIIYLLIMWDSVNVSSYMNV